MTADQRKRLARDFTTRFMRDAGACTMSSRFYVGMPPMLALRAAANVPGDARWVIHRLGWETEWSRDCDCRFAVVFCETASEEMLIDALEASGHLSALESA